jgi:hypothetical protein
MELWSSANELHIYEAGIDFYSQPRLTKGSTGAAEASFEWFLSVFGGGPVNRGVMLLNGKSTI